jgi:hypothetical protein
MTLLCVRQSRRAAFVPRRLVLDRGLRARDQPKINRMLRCSAASLRDVAGTLEHRCGAAIECQACPRCTPRERRTLPFKAGAVCIEVNSIASNEAPTVRGNGARL